MLIDIPYLTNAYFQFDAPAPLKLKSKETIEIKPISLKDSAIFMSCVDVLMIDKNSTNSVEVIQMPYLQFLFQVIAQMDRQFYQKIVNLFVLSCGIEWLNIAEENGKPYLVSDKFTKMTCKDFDNFRKIVLYQNILHYDDEYINPELRQAMDEVKALKAGNIDFPSTERQMAIITAHCGLPKREQLQMTMRAHSMLFEEVRGEVEYSAIKPIALYAGQGADVEWIFPKKSNKFDGYFVNEKNYNKQMGGNGQVTRSADNNKGDSLEKFNLLGG